jgi:hypothetical protein
MAIYTILENYTNLQPQKIPYPVVKSLLNLFENQRVAFLIEFSRCNVLGNQEPKQSKACQT